MKVAKSNLSAESFDNLRYMICTSKKTTFVDLPPTSAAIQGHLLHAYYYTNISRKILDTTKSMLQPLNFCVREMPKKFKIKCVCKASCGNLCACRKQIHMCKILKTSEL